MTISKEEIKADFERFIRHEAMRANCTQSEIREIIESKQEEPVSEDIWETSKQYALRQVLASTDTEMTEQAYFALNMFSGHELAVAHKDGMLAMKQQIMKDAIDCFVGPREGWFYIGPLIPQHYYNLEKDEEIKMVIIKE